LKFLLHANVVQIKKNIKSVNTTWIKKHKNVARATTSVNVSCLYSALAYLQIKPWSPCALVMGASAKRKRFDSIWVDSMKLFIVC